MVNILTEQDADKLMDALGSGQGYVTQQNLSVAVNWAIEQIAGYALLELVFDGKMLLKVADDGELAFIKTGAFVPSRN